MSHKVESHPDKLQFVSQQNANQAEAGTDILKAMGMLAGLLSKYEGQLAQYTQSTEKSQSQLSNVTLKGLENDIKKMHEQLKKIEKQEHEQTHRSFWGKIVHVAEVAAVVVTVVVAVVSLVVAPELLPATALAVGLAIATMTGGTQDMQKLLSGVLVKMGVPPEVANLTVDTAMIILTVVAAVATGNVMGLEAAAEMGAEEGVEVGAEVGAEAGEEAANSTTQAIKNALSKPAQFFTRLTRAIGPKAGLAILAGSEVLGGLPVAQDLINILPLSQKEKDKLLPIMEAIQMVIALMGSLVGGGAFSTAATTAATEAEEGTGLVQKAISVLKNMNEKMGEFLPTLQRNLLKLDAGLNLGVAAGSATLEGLNSESQLKISDANKALGPIRGNLILENTTIDMANEGFKQTVAASNQDYENISSMYNSFNHLGDFWQAVAQQTV